MNITTGKENTAEMPHYTPEQRQVLVESAAKRGYRAYNPLRFLYEEMGILTIHKNGRLRAVRLCFRDYNLTFWLV